MRRRDVAGAGLVSVTLGAIGCGEPARPAAVDASALFSQQRTSTGDAWRKYLEPQALHAAWAPRPESPWRPYYRPTLIAAVAVVKDAAGPLRSPDAEAADKLAARFVEQVDLKGAAIFVDLPGEESVTWGMALLAKGLQPVVTFNNWPHQKGLLKLERPLGALLYHAERAEAQRPAATALPVFLLERSRLARKELSPGPDTFDNRYFHAATDFPGAALLHAAGVQRIVYMNPRGTEAGVEEDDLNAYFVALKAAGLAFTYACPGAAGLVAKEVAPSPRTTIFEAAGTTSYVATSSGHYYRPYSHYHHYHGFWRGSSGTWGSGVSGGGGSSGFSS